MFKKKLKIMTTIRNLKKKIDATPRNRTWDAGSK